ncbi:unnamed protein product [Cylicocyclus nassatus]|uniref:Uncharacterized protein n=1 Tax=Cylicocyclus nassatus TaxID=53992 RepID=A0AA36GMA0_CYLNA|nr:unnamed protein product [Cylicocyclus nassatus]
MRFPTLIDESGTSFGDDQGKAHALGRFFANVFEKADDDNHAMSMPWAMARISESIDDMTASNPMSLSLIVVNQCCYVRHGFHSFFRAWLSQESYPRFPDVFLTDASLRFGCAVFLPVIAAIYFFSPINVPESAFVAAVLYHD